MTRLVASVIADTPDELYERARQAAKTADLVEVRLDGPTGLPWDLRAYFEGLDKPAIATLRHELDGGRSHADDATRAEVLRRALRAGAAYVDIELWSDEAATLTADAHAMGAKVILSRHDFTGTPSADEMLEEMRQARKLGADVVKLATTLQNADDARHLVEAAALARREGIPLALMAVNDAMLRLLGPTLGLALVYASADGAPATAPGQVSVSRLRDVHEELGGAGARPSTGTTRAAFLLGSPVAHSKSPRMHDAAFVALGIDARYLALDTHESGLGPLLSGLKRTNALGANVTIPHKVAVMPHLDALDPSAERAGAVNTIVFEHGRATGHNTDGAGALDALAEAGVQVQGRNALVLGAGGTARAVLASLHKAGAKLTVANRTKAHADALATDFDAAVVAWEEVEAAASTADLVIHATSLGLLDDRAPLRVAALDDGAAVLDCVYRAGGTELIKQARARNLVAVAGESMLLHQGARAFKLWTGQDAPLAAMRTALEDTG